jgi:hypothetical protein
MPKMLFIQLTVIDRLLFLLGGEGKGVKINIGKIGI